MSGAPTSFPVSLSDEQLLGLMATHQLICGRSKAALKRKNRKFICGFMTALQIEADLRGIPHSDRATDGADLSA